MATHAVRDEVQAILIEAPVGVFVVVSLQTHVSQPCG
jgi:hypothetical protein